MPDLAIRCQDRCPRSDQSARRVPSITGRNRARYRTGQNTPTLRVAPQGTQYVWATITDACGRTVSSSRALLAVPAPCSCQ